MFQNVLICTDLSDGLQRLVNFVPSLAASGLKRITFLHTLSLSPEQAIPRPDLQKEQQIRDRLSTALHNVPAGVDVQIDVKWGKPLDHILQASKTHGSDLILSGMPIRNRLDESLFGSTTLGLCQRLAIPVLIVRPQLISAFTEEELDLRCRHLFRYLLIPYDGAASATYLVQQIKRRVQSPGSALESCLITWVVEDSGRKVLRGHQLEEAKKQIITAQHALEGLNLQLKTLVCEGEPLANVLNFAVEYDISAIAISSSSMGKLVEWSSPSFTRELLHRSWHPVLYFPGSQQK